MTKAPTVARRSFDRSLADLADLELTLGDPACPESPMSFAKTVALDEREELPEEALALLHRWGLEAYYVPEELGGRLSSFPALTLLLECVARRDLTAALAHSASLLGALPVWLAGSPGQRRSAAEILIGGDAIAFGMTERDHGSDLQATETRAEQAGSGWRLTGEKWLINNATRGRAITVFARTGERGPRGHSLFLVDKERIAASSWAPLPRVPTLGIRGADISGIRFSECELGGDSVLEPPGSGLELAMKTLQVSRTIVPALSLGLADTALRTTLSWARQRRLYGAPIVEIPYVRSVLAGSLLDLLVCESLVRVAARGLHVAPEQQGLRSAVVKAFVPTTLETVVQRLATVLGSRYFLRAGHDSGIFQKVHREIGLIGLFDGSTVVNLGAVALQMPRLARRRRRAKDRERGAEATESVVRLFDPLAPLPPFGVDGLTLATPGRDDLTGALLQAEAWIDRSAVSEPIDREVRESISRSVGRLASMVDHDDALLSEVTGWRGDLELSPDGFHLARRHCRIQASAACLFHWLHARTHAEGFWARGGWVAAALERLADDRLDGREVAIPDDTAERLVDELLRRESPGPMFNSLGLALPRESKTLEEAESE